MMKRLMIWVVVIFGVGVVPMMAQAVSCAVFVDDALSTLGDYCADLPRDRVCYGHRQVEATFFDDVADDVFAEPSERAELNTVRTVHTTALDIEQNQFGVAVMNLQANIPNTVAGTGAVMLLLGDSSVENNVDPELANIIRDPLSTVVTAPSNIYLSPAYVADVIDVRDVGSVVWVDGVNPTREWLRVVNDGLVGWIRTANVTRLASIDRLSVVGASHPSAMQSLYLRTGFGEADCFEAEPMIALQTPESIVVDMTINGVDMKVDGMVTFKNLDENTIKLTVHRGQVSTVFGNTITAGQSVVGVLDTETEQGTIVSWGDVFAMTIADAALGERAQTALNDVAYTNAVIEEAVVEEVVVEEAVEEEVVVEEAVVEEQPVGELEHIVSSGENLFRIGRLYNTSLIEIVNRNDLSEPYTLFAGDVLWIPNPDSGFVGLPTSNAETGQPASLEGTCEGFRLTSPLAGVPTEATSYYWDGVIGATQYQVNLYDATTGLLMGTGRTIGAETSIVFSAGEFGIGGMLRWEVLAYGDGALLCRTGLSQPMTHFAPVDPSE